MAGSGQREEEPAAAAASDVSGIDATPMGFRRHAKIEETTEGPKEEDMRESKSAAKRRNASNNKKNIKRTSGAMGQADQRKKVKVEAEPVGDTVATTCKKSDGKGWHCKRQAQRPHTLCKYHLTQVRSYYSNGGGNTTHVLQQQQQQPSFPKVHDGGSEAKQQACGAVIQDKNVNVKKKSKKKGDSNGNRSGVCHNGAAGRTRRKAASDFYYYYSGFGPWWGKSRSGGGDRDGRDRGVASSVESSDGDDGGGGGGGDGTCDGVPPPPRVHDQKPDDLDEDDEDDADVMGGVGELDGDDVVAIKRKGRKPVKARSLKSLL